MERLGRVVFAVLFCALFAGTGQAQEKFKLKPGAKGKVCLGCHVTFEETMKNPFVHTPVRAGECSGCHNPHTAGHANLLDAGADKVCSRCHTVLPPAAKSSHKVVADGACTVCHDPHAAKNRNNLLKAGNELCYTCHPAMRDRVEKAKFRHKPAAQSCLNCHGPHASAGAPALLRKAVPDLCTGCHRTDGQLFVKQHQAYPVASSDCTSCHDPHGSARGGILYDTVHKPVAGRMCSQCHDEPAAGKPVTLKKSGVDLCKGCHSTMVASLLDRNHVHAPVLSQAACLSCHTPHASTGKGLLKASAAEVCGSCHADTIDRQTRSQTKHAPITEGNCTACHQPHASDATFLLGQPVIETCGNCHDWQKHSTHPLGEKVRDRRNKNLSVQCLSCHSAHGTDFKTMILYPTVSELCTQCHVEYRR